MSGDKNDAHTCYDNNDDFTKATENIGDCEGGADCGDGWCCYDAEYPVCCPDTDHYINWCASDFDSCPEDPPFDWCYYEEEYCGPQNWGRYYPVSRFFIRPG